VVAHVERGRAAVRGRSAVVGGQLLSQEAVRRSCGARDGGDEAGGGTAWVDIAEVLGVGRHSLVTGERRWGGAVRGGGRQLTTRGGCTRQHGAQGVVEAVGEGLERQSVAAQRWWVWWGLER
jgi:hypothetical protein